MCGDGNWTSAAEGIKCGGRKAGECSLVSHAQEQTSRSTVTPVRKIPSFSRLSLASSTDNSVMPTDKAVFLLEADSKG